MRCGKVVEWGKIPQILSVPYQSRTFLMFVRLGEIVQIFSVSFAILHREIDRERPDSKLFLVWNGIMVVKHDFRRRKGEQDIANWERKVTVWRRERGSNRKREKRTESVRIGERKREQMWKSKRERERKKEMKRERDKEGDKDEERDCVHVLQIIQ